MKRVKTGGRKAGVPNKIKSPLKQTIQEAIEKNFETLADDLLSLEPEKRLQLIEKYLKYILPTQSSVTAEIDMNNITDDQLEIIINAINYKENGNETDN